MPIRLSMHGKVDTGQSIYNSMETLFFEGFQMRKIDTKALFTLLHSDSLN